MRRLLLYPLARRFFAGTTLASAVTRARRDNAEGLGATLDYMGEHTTDGGEAGRAADEYARVIAAIAAGKLDASLAVKLTHIGLDIDRALAEEGALRIAGEAAGNGVPLWVDMEGSAHTDDTIAIYRKLLGVHKGCGVALQACLKRTWDDLAALVPEGARVRLVKGAYDEPPAIALQDMGKIRAQFAGMLEYLAAGAAPFALGTHDTLLIKKALGMGIGRDRIEFQMLMGMRGRLKRELARSGWRVVEYVPYGSDWYGYGMRRIMEKRRNIVYFAQGLFGR